METYTPLAFEKMWVQHHRRRACYSSAMQFPSEVEISAAAVMNPHPSPVAEPTPDQEKAVSGLTDQRILDLHVELQTFLVTERLRM